MTETSFSLSVQDAADLLRGFGPRPVQTDERGDGSVRLLGANGVTISYQGEDVFGDARFRDIVYRTPEGTVFGRTDSAFVFRDEFDETGFAIIPFEDLILGSADDVLNYETWFETGIGPYFNGQDRVIDFGEGNDTLVLDTWFAGDLSALFGSVEVEVNAAGEIVLEDELFGTVTARNLERIEFLGSILGPPVTLVLNSDGQIVEASAMGLSVEEARTVAYLYEAGLDRDGNIDLPGLNFWIDRREDGLSERQLSRAFLESAEFVAAFGEAFDQRSLDYLDNRALVEQLYRNVLDREGEMAGVDFWTGRVSDPGFTRADLLLAFAGSPENVAGSPAVETLTEIAPGEWDFLA